MGGNYVQQIILAQKKHKKIMRIDKNKSQGGMYIVSQKEGKRRKTEHMPLTYIHRYIHVFLFCGVVLIFLLFITRGSRFTKEAID